MDKRKTYQRLRGVAQLIAEGRAEPIEQYCCFSTEDWNGTRVYEINVIVAETPREKHLREMGSLPRGPSLWSRLMGRGRKLPAGCGVIQ